MVAQSPTAETVARDIGDVAADTSTPHSACGMIISTCDDDLLGLTVQMDPPGLLDTRRRTLKCIGCDEPDGVAYNIDQSHHKPRGGMDGSAHSKASLGACFLSSSRAPSTHIHLLRTQT